MVTDKAQRRERVQAAWRRMGLSGALLSAAVLADVLVAAMSAIGEREPWRPFVLLPGVFALAACAVFARRSPQSGALFGAAALVVCSPFAGEHAHSYVALLEGVSISETVAGVQLVMLAVRHLTPVRAFAATSVLVAGGIVAVALRAGLPSPQTPFVGLALLVVGVTLGIRTRETPSGDEPSPPAQLAYLSQWPLIGGFALVVFIEFASSTNSPAGVIGLLCSVGAATLAVVSVRHPVTAGLGLAGVLLLTAVVLGLALDYGFPGLPSLPMPVGQILAGMVVVVNVVRERQPGPAAGVVAALTVAVAAVVLVGHWRTEVGRLAFPALLLLGFAIAIGLYLKSRDSARGQALQTAVTEAQTAERMALARELHDVVAHHVTGIVVQAQAAKMLAEQDPALAHQALDRIDRAGVEAMGAMRRLVGSMRSGDAPGDAAATEQATTDLGADLRKLVASANHGVPTELELDVPTDLPHEVARSALRIVQEALTNVGKHATGATRALVAVGVVDGQLGIRVGDDGRASSAERTADEWRDSGYGLIGMRERVELLHGRLSAGPAPDGGWVVEVWLPLEDAAR